MIYLLYGIQNFLIDEKINEIIKTNNINDYNVYKFDMENNDLKNIIDSINTISLFDNKKIVIIDNSYIFTGSTKKTSDVDLEYLDNYLDNYNKDAIVIFKVLNEKLDSRKKLVSKIKNVAEVIEYNKFNISSKVKDMFVPYQINYSDIEFFINRCGNDLDNLKNEITKLKTYKDNDLVISKDDIEQLTYKNVNTDIFYLIDNIILNNKEKALESYYEMIKRGEEPIKIIIMLANQFRLIYQVKELYKKGYREYDIMDILEQKQYPIKKASEKMNKYSSDKVLDCLYKLAELDINIKSGIVDKNIGLELFILNI